MGKCKILIVEDELIVRQAERYIIESKSEKYEIAGEVSNGREAIELLASVEVHVVICDINMPIVNGMDLAKHIRMKYPHIYIVVLSGYGDFDYVKNCFQYGVFEYILKPKLTAELLHSILDRICIKIGIETTDETSGNFIEEILKGYAKGSMPEQFQKKEISCIGINLNKIIGYEEEKDQLYFETISSNISSFFEHCTIEYYLTKDNIFMGLLAFDEINMFEFTSELKLLIRALSSEIFGLKLAYSSITTEFEEVVKSVINTKDCTKQQVFLPNDMEIYKSYDIVRNKVGVYKGYKEKIDFFDDAYQYLIHYINETTYQSGYDEDEFKKQIEYISYIAFDTYAAEDDFEEGDGMDQFKAMKMISQMYSLDDLVEYVVELFSIIHARSGGVKHNTDTLLQRIVEFIKENYYEQLNLKQVAERFHISYSYLSTYFNHNLGMGFNEYLNKVRIENAKQMLRSSDLTISEICEKTGYLDQSYFSKIFKKLTGQSPSSYRREL